MEDSENRPPTRSAVKFEIRFDESKPTASAPKRFSEQPIRPSVSQEELEKKQRDAEERRKKEEQARLDRIHQTEQETKRFCEATAPIIELINEGPSSGKK